MPVTTPAARSVPMLTLGALLLGGTLSGCSAGGSSATPSLPSIAAPSSATAGGSPAPAVPTGTDAFVAIAPGSFSARPKVSDPPVVRGSATLEALVPPASTAGAGYVREGGSTGIAGTSSLYLCGTNFGASDALRTDALHVAFAPPVADHPTATMSLVAYRAGGVAAALEAAKGGVQACGAVPRPSAAPGAQQVVISLTALRLAAAGSGGLAFRQTTEVVQDNKVVRSTTTVVAFAGTGAKLAAVASTGGTFPEQERQVSGVLTAVRSRLASSQ